MKHLIIILILIFTHALAFSQGHIEGKVMVADMDGSGDTVILPGANIFWAGTTTGTSANAAGYFTLKRGRGHNLLVASFVGYNSDTVRIEPGTEYIEIFLKESSLIDEVTVIGRATGAHIDRDATIATVKITAAELCKAACCNLSESFVTNPSVDVNYADAATGAKQIQLLGLA